MCCTMMLCAFDAYWNNNYNGQSDDICWGMSIVNAKACTMYITLRYASWILCISWCFDRHCVWPHKCCDISKMIFFATNLRPNFREISLYILVHFQRNSFGIFILRFWCSIRKHMHCFHKLYTRLRRL